MPPPGCPGRRPDAPADARMPGRPPNLGPEITIPDGPAGQHHRAGHSRVGSVVVTDSPPTAAANPRRTPLTGVHEKLGASLTDFAGWLMPLRYGSETAEHTAVRTAAGLFDLSHMGEFAVTGPGAAAALDYALTGEPSALRPGRARYTMICADDGGILDDLIVYRLADEEFLVVANAANAAVVGAALSDRVHGRDAQVSDRTDDYALIAIQGPRAAAILAPSRALTSPRSSTTPATRRG